MSTGEPGVGESPLLHIELGIYADTAVVSARGEIDAHTAAQLQAALDEVLAGLEPAGANGGTPVVDLSAVGFLGSAGLSVLLTAARAVEPQRLRVAVSPQVARIIEVTGLDSVFAVYDDLATALHGNGS